MKRLVLTVAAAANLLLLDQAVKAWTQATLRPGATIPVVAGFFDIAHVQNRGCAWGLLQGHVWPLAVFAVIAMAFLAWRRKDVFPQGAWGAAAETMLYAGIAGNLVDRAWLGHVVDMFDFHWGAHHFPCFNVADSLITLAAGILVVCSFGGKRSS